MISLSIELERYSFTAVWENRGFLLLLNEQLFVRMLVASGVVGAEKAVTAAIEKLSGSADAAWRPRAGADGVRLLTHDEAVSVLIALGNVKAARMLGDLRDGFERGGAELDGWLAEIRGGAPGGAAPQSREDFQARQRQEMLDALNRHGWNKLRAANDIGMPRRTFYRKLAEYGLEAAAPAPVAAAAPAPVVVPVAAPAVQAAPKSATKAQGKGARGDRKAARRPGRKKS